MQTQVGERVGAILSANAETVQFLGYGTFQGEVVPDDPAVGFMGVSFQELNRTNPCILLDNGDKVYDCECWWGSEEKVREMIGERTVVEVRIADYRPKPPGAVQG